MATVKNTAESGRGFTVDGRDYKIPAGETIEVPDDSLARARRDELVEGMFVDGTFVVVAPAQAEAHAAVPSESTPETKAEAPKGKGTHR